LQRAEITTTAAPGAPSLPMNAIWRTIRGYILWSYERGTLHYDIMVTLILIFVFGSPYWINFNDKPIPRNPHPSGVVVTPDAQGRLVYEIDARAIKPGDDRSIREQLLRLIEPISGTVSIVEYQVVTDGKGKIKSYRAVVKRG
jgi:hypothetical protein